MPDDTPTRSVKFSNDERLGWSSERPRREGEAPRLPDISTRCRVLGPTDRMRYSPGSLLLIVGPVASEPDRFAERVLEERGVVVSPARVHALLAGRVPEQEIPARAEELLQATVLKRMEAGSTVVVPLVGFDPAERERLIRTAHRFRRPRHLIMLDATREQLDDDERPLLDDLRRRLDAGEVGQEGFQTALRLGGATVAELKRIVFKSRPRDDD